MTFRNNRIYKPPIAKLDLRKQFDRLKLNPWILKHQFVLANELFHPSQDEYPAVLQATIVWSWDRHRQSDIDKLKPVPDLLPNKTRELMQPWEKENFKFLEKKLAFTNKIKSLFFGFKLFKFLMSAPAIKPFFLADWIINPFGFKEGNSCKIDLNSSRTSFDKTFILLFCLSRVSQIIFFSSTWYFQFNNGNVSILSLQQNCAALTTPDA